MLENDSRGTIFSLLDKDKVSLKRNGTENKSAIWTGAENGPCFGQDIWISSRCLSNSNVNQESFCILGHSFGMPIRKKKRRVDDSESGTDRAKEILAGSYHFRTAEI